jgi:predicted nucleic acid-binding protein
VTHVVLDASAVMAFFVNRAGGQEVEELIHRALAGRVELSMSIINWGEVYYSVWQVSGEETAKQMAAELSQLPIELVEADLDLTRRAAGFRAVHKLPYADSFAAALADQRSAEIYTADRHFSRVQSKVSIHWIS